MTRTEKFRAYRNEIKNMKFDTPTSKIEVSKEVDKVHSSFHGSKLNYDDVMLIQEEVNGEEVNFKRKKYIGLTKYEILYFLVLLFVVIILSVLLVLTGIKLWG